MPRLSRLAACALLLTLAALAPAQAKKPTLDTVSYADLTKMVRDLKGKVVVVYLWAYG